MTGASQTNTSSIDTGRIVRVVLAEQLLHWDGVHGLSHWARVLENGLRLAETTGADVPVVTLFALFHDSKRENDGHDPEHGLRGARFAREVRSELFELDDQRFETLYYACQHHTSGVSHHDVTVQTCWDSDRLDLGRVGIMPDPRRLLTAPARLRETLEWANERSTVEALNQHSRAWMLAAGLERTAERD
jgi:uncharacterized protein